MHQSFISYTNQHEYAVVIGKNTIHTIYERYYMFKNVTIASLILIGSYSISTHTTSVQSIEISDEQKLSQKLDEYISTSTAQDRFSCSVLIAKKDTILLNKGYGCANYEFNIPNDHTTRFSIGSNTKIFTAVAIMLLQEQDLLNVHDPVAKHISGFPQTITLHHLLTHTSGVPNYYKQWDSICEYNDLNEIINVIKNWELEFSPGSQYCYSNTGYLILAHIIEKLSGASLETFLSKHILEPLHMHDTGSICNGHMILRKASGYFKRDAILYNASTIMSPITLLGSGDLYSSTTDMHTFIQALFTGAIISKDNLATTLSCHVMMKDSLDRAHGYGWFIDKKQNKRIVEYSGWIRGFVSKVMHFVDDNITIIVLTNREDPDSFFNFCDELATIVCCSDIQ